MKSEILVLALVLIVIAVVAPVATIAYSNANGSSRNGSPYSNNMMGGMMGDTEDIENEDWWDEMKEHMEEHMGEFEDEDWWDKMLEEMEDLMDEIENHMEDDEEDHDHACMRAQN